MTQAETTETTVGETRYVKEGKTDVELICRGLPLLDNDRQQRFRLEIVSTEW